MPLAVDPFFRSLEAGDLPRVIAIGGEERVYVDDALATIREKALAGGLADFNHDRVSGRERKLAEILQLARTYPVMAKQRLVEVRDPAALNDAELVALTAYLDAPAADTVLTFVFGDMDLRDKLVKLLDKKAALVRFEHPRDRDMPQHVVRRARRTGLKLDPDAIDALAVTVGADLTLLERALEKLALVVGKDETVSVAHVSAHVADTHLEDAFALARAVARGELPAALGSLARLQIAREEPLRLLGLLAWQLRQLANIRAHLDDGASPQDVGSRLNLYGERLSTAVQASRRLDGPAHGRRLVRLAAADQLLKGSRQPAWLIMTRLILDLCAPTAAAGARSAAPPRR